MSKQKVYISSTFRDLEPYRGIVIRELEGAFSEGFELCRIMEYMYDDGNSVPFVEACKRQVQESQVYLLILGSRVGSFPPGSDKTYTEEEYDTALSSGKLIFRFVNKRFDEQECDDLPRFRRFSERLKGLPVHEFSDLPTFENKLLRCLSYMAQVSITNQRRFYITLAVIIGIAGVAAASLVPYWLEGYSPLVIAGFVLLILVIFSCIALFVLKYIIFPTSLSTLKKNTYAPAG